MLLSIATIPKFCCYNNSMTICMCSHGDIFFVIMDFDVGLYLICHIFGLINVFLTLHNTWDNVFIKRYWLTC